MGFERYDPKATFIHRSEAAPQLLVFFGPPTHPFVEDEKTRRGGRAWYSYILCIPTYPGSDEIYT